MFGYDGSGRLCSVQKAADNSGYTYGTKLGFAYNSASQAVCFAEYGSDNTQGNSLTITYGTDNTTEFTDSRNRSETSTFDNEGNRISVLNANGYLQSESGSGLLVSGGAESFTKNYITFSTNPNDNFVLENGSREGVTSSGGSIDYEGSNDPNRYFGASAVKVNNPTSNDNAAFFSCAKHEYDIHDDFNDEITSGSKLTFSAYVKTENVQQIYNEGSVGACLMLKFSNSSHAPILNVSSIGITGNENWQRLSVSATVPNNTSCITIYCNLRYASGTAWFDCFQLEDGNCANDFNALQDADFAVNNNHWYDSSNNAVTPVDGAVTLTGASGVYNNAPVETATEGATEPEEQYETQVVTEYETSPNDSVVTYDSYGNAISNAQGFVNRLVKKTYIVDQGTTTIEPTEDPSAASATEPEDGGADEEYLTNNYVYQNVTVNRSGVIFNLVGEAQAKSVPLTNENRTFGIALKINYSGGGTEEHYQEFNSNTDKRQTVNLVVYPNDLDKVIASVDFAFVYGYNENTMTVYNAMLNIAETGYTADTDEPEATEPATTEPEVEDDYDDYIDYEVLSESVDTSQPYMHTSTGYDSTGNYVMSETDEAGNTVTYTRDSKGNITSITDAEDCETEYTYNAAGEVTSISNDGVQNTYHYNALGNLSSIDHNGFSYAFNYDIYDRVASTSVANTTLVSNTYDSYGNLTRSDYANRDYLSYTYDQYDRVVTIVDEGGHMTTFTYNKKGLVAKEYYQRTGNDHKTVYYYYDFSGNKTGEYRQTFNGGLEYYISYDGDGNRVEKISSQGVVKTVTTGSDEDGNSFVDNDGMTVTSITDDFGRVSSVTTNCDNEPKFSTLYEYAAGSAANSTTKQISKLSQYVGDVNDSDNKFLEYNYEYYDNGNLYKISDGTNFIRYNYDSNNQLIIRFDGINRYITYYTYDVGGNITRVEKRNLNSNGIPTTLISEDTYTYGTTGWKDQLVSYNNESITYDEMGNPLNYRGGMSFEWMSGRMLEKIHKNGSTVQMVYDSDGMRTHKNTVTYEYDSDKKLISMTKGSDTLLFYYDTDGNPIAVKKGNNIYYYIRNLQGDIVKIVNKLDRAIVNYQYDEWGRILSITNRQGTPITSDTNIGLLNPFRYRGYVYDDETGLYYLQSRYYDPVTGRFINADVYCDTQSGSPLSTNTYCYCENNSLLAVDYNGRNYRYIGNHIYAVDNQEKYNCYSYALGFTYGKLRPGTRGYDYDYYKYTILRTPYLNEQLKYKSFFELKEKNYNISTVYSQVKKDLNSMGIKYRPAKKSTKLEKGEYRIAIRVMNMYYYNRYGDKVYYRDFHFMKQDPKTKHWWQKRGKSYVHDIGKVDVDKDIYWQYTPTIKLGFYGVPYYSPLVVRDELKHKDIVICYNSVTKYLIIKKNFWRLTYND